MGRIINIETSTDVCSVCLAIDGQIVAMREEPGRDLHASYVTVFIDEILRSQNLAATDLDAIAVSRGPGSYTGLRIGASIAKGLAYSLDKPLISICSLQALAMASAREENDPNGIYWGVTDARRMDVWGASFDMNGNNLTLPDLHTINDDFFETHGSEEKILYFSGNGATKTCLFASTIKHKDIDRQASAAFLAPLSQLSLENSVFENVVRFEPHYINPPKIVESKRPGRFSHLQT